MKATALFVIAMMVVAMFSTVVLAQTTNAPATTNTPAVATTPTPTATPTTATTVIKATKVEKGIWGLIYPKAVFDSLDRKYSGFTNDDEYEVPKTWGEKREYDNYRHDKGLRSGDTRFVNMFGVYKHETMTRVASKFTAISKDMAASSAKMDTVAGIVNTVVTAVKAVVTAVKAVEIKQAKTDSSIASLVFVVSVLEKSTTRMRWVLTGDKTQVPVPDGVRAVTRTEDATMKASDAGMELLKLENAALKAVGSGTK
ncbi:hypothetical protein D4R51_03965 [bacterium]|nr:MAG: hypothetical protein D4R51_03965 [bacterium]